MTGSKLRRLCVPVAASLGLSVLAILPASAAVPPSVNVDLPASCGIDFTMVLDTSGSVNDTLVKAAANEFLENLADTGSVVSLVSFANSGIAQKAPTQLTVGPNLEALQDKIDNLSFGGFTNWEDGLVKAQSQFANFLGGKPQLVVMITDGNPNRYNVAGSDESTAVDRAVTQANLIRDAGVHMFAVGVQGTPSINTASLQAISGTDEYPTAGISAADWTQVDGAGDLSSALRNVATDLCQESVVVHKLAAGKNGPGFQYTATDSPAKVTGSDGRATFSWDDPTGKQVTITETPNAAYPLESISCFDGNNEIGSVSGNSVSLFVGPDAFIECTFSTPVALPAGGSGGAGGDGGAGGAGGDGETATPDPRAGYWMLGQGGKVFAFGGAVHMGEPTANIGSAEALDLEPTPTGNGYWILDSKGKVYVYGDAKHFGNADMSKLVAGETVSSISPTPSGKGYWIFTSKGRALIQGDAKHFGDMAGTVLNGPVLDSIPTPTGKGYYMVASDGGIFAFGDAKFYGSMGGKKLNKPVMSLAPDQDRKGYWLVAEDGGIFAFEAPFRGSMGDKVLNKPVTGMVQFGNGYLMVAEDGGIFNFSNLAFFGSLGNNPPARPITSVAVLDL